ncbi:MAG: nicotinamide riboside transporter PnuC [Tannerellaceae bacterium]|jgi:nicotinamide mononucleotide transporter|nr:nicotinamide riboside transporter PnuC [Tannerellaceae bacterium]
MNIYIEIFGVLTGLLYLYFQIKQRTWMWVLGIVTGLIYAGVFMKKGVYAQMLLQVYFVLAGIYGIWRWKYRKGAAQETGIVYRRLTLKLGLMLVAAICVLSVTVYFALMYLGEGMDSPAEVGASGLTPEQSAVVFWKRAMDAFTMSASVVATLILAYKIIEHWLFWIFSDAVLVGLCVLTGLYPSTVLYSCYIALAVVGYRSWRKNGRQL